MSATEALRAGDPERIGPFRLIGRLGEGGQGVVFLGERALPEEGEEAPAGPVAVKLLRAWLGHDPEARARFMRELDTAKRVARFCTAAVLDADVDGDHPYIVSEYVDGPSLHQVVRAEGPRDGGVLERLAVGTATALVAIHQAGVVHRDFKPHNVLLGPDGPRVIDFGIARALDGSTITASGVGMGTPAYMAPEQLAGERAGPAADVFAWAGTMVFASCGRPPFGDDNLTAVAHRVLYEAPRLGALPGPLRELAARCLEKDPALRPPAPQVLRTLLGEPEPEATDPLPPAVLRAAAVAGTGPGLTPAPPAPPASSTLADGPPPATVPAAKPGGGVPGVVAVSGAVIAVSVAVVVTVLALTGAFPFIGGGGGPSGGASTPPQANPRVTTTTTTTATASTPGVPDEPQTPPDGQDPPEDPAGFPAAFAGTWTGQVRQNDGKVFPVALTLPEGGRQGRVSYPQHACSGVVTLIGEPGERSLALREQITSNTQACVDTGTTTLARETGGALRFGYRGTSQGQTWTVEGTLSRS
ncbi:serine/threonine-protein kinase [Actinomadura rugatobispora]|uniref:Serine/threonine-protein kinase n=1 Tax=Actinomadura rugatobispora TaxID=1994 RepID=A0ABW1AE54_9ACTN|nr:hypothetical protein GCM10010200_068470 [Actinomadura rugatobispora]